MFLSFKSIHSWLLLVAALFVISSCTDLDYDNPPAGGSDPNLPVNATIADLKAKHVLGQYEEITEDLTVAALVVSNDEAGNFFKQLVVQDSSGGIEIRIDVTDLHAIYPVGRKIYIKAKGLWLGDYNGLIQLGSGVGTDDQGRPELIRIPEPLLANYIKIATYGNPVVPKIKTIDQLTYDDVSTLIQFNNVQFITADTGETYADAVLQQTLNREIEDCSRTRIIVRTSGFAVFANQLTPGGGGSLVGVLSIFGSTYQMTIRDLNDVVMNGPRCASNQFTASALRQLYAQGTTTVPGGTVTGVVISDYKSKSVEGHNVVIQDATGGIVLRFTDFHSFNLGDQISVDVSGGNLSEYRGWLQVDGLDIGAGSVISHPGDVTPRNATVLEVLNNAQTWESTLVRIDKVILTANSIYKGDVTVKDATGSMVLHTFNTATFANDALPTDTVSIIAIISEFDVPQLTIRNASDVSGGGSSGTSEFTADTLRQMFAQGTTTVPNGTLQGVVISDYTTQSVTGRNLYIQDATGGIVVRFTANPNFDLGDEIKVDISGTTLLEFNGLLEVDAADNANVTVIGHPGDVTPRGATVADVLSNLQSWESTLVKIDKVVLSGNTVYNGSVTVTDKTGSMILFTRSAATFANTALPTDTVSITSIISEFTTPQLIIRNTTDVKQ